MSDIYRIAVNLAMTSNAPAFFTSLASQIAGVHVKVKDLEGSLSRVKLAVGGALGVAVGSEFLKSLKAITDQAAELNRQLATTGTFSSNALTSIGLQGQALATARATAKAVPGTSLEESVKLFNETYSMFGAKNASKINAPLAKMAMVLGGITGNYESAFDDLQSLVKSGDLTGKIMNAHHEVDTDKLMGYLNIAARVAAVTGGRVGPATFFQLAQQGGPGLKNMSDEGLMGVLMAAQGMGGFRAGTATMSLFQQFAGGKMSEAVAKELKGLGLVGNFHASKGGGVVFDRGGLDTPFLKQLGKDPLAAIGMLRETLDKHGIHGDDQTKELFKILGRQTTMRLVNDFMTNLEQMVQERGRALATQGVDEQNKSREDQDYDRNLHDVQTAWHNLMAEIGLPLTYKAIEVMHSMTKTLQGWTEAIQKTDPKFLQDLAVGVGILGTSLIAAGGVALLAALGPAGWVVLGLGALVAVFRTYAPKQFDEWLEGFKKVVHGIFTLDWKEIVKGVGEEFSAAFHLLPGNVIGAINDAIKSMAEAIKNALKDFFTLEQPGRNQGYRKKTSFDGGGVFGGSLINASWSGAANDNSAKVLAGSITGGITNSNVVILGGGGGGFGGGLGGFGGGGGLGRFGGVGGGRGSNIPLTGFSSRAGINLEEVRQYIRAAAVANGIGPDIAERVARAEGLNRLLGAGGDGGTSDGPFQLHVGGGLGDIYQRLTGHSIHDMRYWKDQVDFALREARKNGWTPWHGAANSGISKWQGIGAPPQARRSVHIHKHYLDGKQIEARVTSHQAQGGQYPTDVGGIDSYGSFASPGTYLDDVA